jgi:lipopolysaccharide/colanic/teichoic acid biosynthesis glycosyltransferase
MSSHTTTAFETGRSNLRTQRVWSNREIVAHGMALIMGFLMTAFPAHHAGRSLSSLALVGGALFCATFLPQRYLLVESSPLEIHRTTRLLQGIILGLAVALIAAALLPRSGVLILKLFLSFVVLLVAIRGLLKIGLEPSVQRREDHVAPVARGRNMVGKRWLDKLIAIAALAILAPLLLVIAVAVKLDSAGPVFFSHQRVGYKGRRFWIIKFRSMHVHAAKYRRSPSDLKDSRITRVGRVLRRLSLDEVPQLLNVLRGEMSLVGPRPEMPYIARTYTALQRTRLEALPGMTGLWQISPARALPIHQNIQYDLYYIAHQSLLLDLAVLCRTAGSVVRGIGAA